MPIHILLVRNCRGITEVTGGEAYILSLLDYIDPKRCVIRLVCATDPSKGETSWLRQLRSRAEPFDNIPVGSRTGLGDLLAVPRLIREFNADVVHSLDHRSDIVGVVGAKVTGRPAVAWFGGWTNFTEGSPKRTLYSWADRQAMKRCETVICDSPYLTAQLDLGSSGPPVIAIPNGIDLRKFDADAIAPDDRRKMFGDEDVIVFGTIGRIHPNKGQLDFVRAAAALSQSHPNCRFIICGKVSPGFEDYSEQVERFIEDHRLGDRIRMTSAPASQIPQVLASLDIVMSPCNTESCSFAVLEGMAMSKPVIAAEAGGNPGLISDGDTGIFVRPQDWDSLRAAAVPLIESEDMRNSIGGRARCRVETAFPIELMAERTMQVYEAVTAFRHGRLSGGRAALREQLYGIGVS